ncbi:hypothetical protein MPSEU_000126700 [Mayamaea pseudoterrestris]|nr:hypothetical protein MPSEU_000125400 [Mayamaea pseudoterrestris]GKY91548.1 hypothetical protein MPSEU_000126700 [Mayamaea pseudoterrestris]
MSTVLARLLLSRLSLTSRRCGGITAPIRFTETQWWQHSHAATTNVRFFGRDKDTHDVDDLFVSPEDQDGDPDAIVIPPELSSKPSLSIVPDIEEDPFGVHFDDGPEQGKVGKTLPPRYKRDATTGRLTGDIEKELTEEEKRILKADLLEKDQILLDRMEQHWKQQGTDESGMPKELFAMGRRVRDAEIGLNVMGRSVKAQASEEELDDGSTLGRDESGFTQNLTKEEFESLSKFMESQFDTEISEDDIPVQASQKRSAAAPQQQQQDEETVDPDELALSLKWLSTRARREMDDSLDDNPYSDLMPGDLSPTRLVNRKRAKPVPTKLLHHNNIELLRRFLTPTGQVMNRVQTRLGARDQRRVAKLIKRSRALGLLPYAGQIKVETHGWKHASDIHEDRPWEKELVRRGLVIKRTRDTVDSSDIK